MKSHIRNLAVVSATATIALAFAAPVSAGGHYNPPSTNCGSYDSLSDWKAVSGDYCIQGDKKYTLIETNLDSDTDIDFDVSGDGLTHTFKVTEDLRSSSSNKNYYIKFAIEVLDDAYEIIGVGLDSSMSENDASGVTTVTKKIYQDGQLIDTLVSTEGTEDSSIALSADALIIEDYIFIPKKDVVEDCDWVWKNGRWKQVCEDYEYKDKLNWFENVFVQALVPPPPPPTDVAEPETLAMFGLGLLALGYLGRRRKA